MSLLTQVKRKHYTIWALLTTFPKCHPNGSSLESKLLPKAPGEVARVGRLDFLRLAGEHDETGRCRAHLRHVEKIDLSAVLGPRGMMARIDLEKLVNLRCGNTL